MKKLFLFCTVLMAVSVAVAQTISSSTIDFRYCFSTSSEETTTVNCGSYDWSGQTYTESGDYVINGLINARGCDSTATLHLTVNDYRTYTNDEYEIEDGESYSWHGSQYTTAGTYYYEEDNANGCKDYYTLTLSVVHPAGVLPNAIFSVSNSGTDTAKVSFSKGNLQYRASNGNSFSTTCTNCLKHNCVDNSIKQGVWRFAEHQYDFVGGTCNGNTAGNVYENNTRCTNNSMNGSYTGWVDLFTFGRSGYDDKTPYSYSNVGIQQSVVTDKVKYDWGYYNEIKDGERIATAGVWRTLTQAEWNYILSTRKNASVKKGYATVCDVKGIVLLPDVWVQPAGLTFVASGTQTGWTANVYSSEAWALMESNGAVFLPVAGKRQDNITSMLVSDQYGSYPAGNYASSTYNSFPKILKFTQNSMGTEDINQRHYGMSVRLVRNR